MGILTPELLSMSYLPAEAWSHSIQAPPRPAVQTKAPQLLSMDGHRRRTEKIKCKWSDSCHRSIQAVTKAALEQQV